MSETSALQLGEEFRLPKLFTLANSMAACDLVMVAHFDDLEARRLHVTPIARGTYGPREGALVEITLDEDGNGNASLVLPMSVEEDVTFVLAVAYRCDLNDLMTLTLTGEGLDPMEQRFFVNALRPKFEPAPAMPSLAERAQLPEGAFVNEGPPWGEEGYIAGGQIYANLGQFGDHPEHAPTGFETAGAEAHGLGNC